MAKDEEPAPDGEVSDSGSGHSVSEDACAQHEPSGGSASRTETLNGVQPNL